MRKRRFYLVLLLMALILLSLPSFAARAARRATGRGSPLPTPA